MFTYILGNLSRGGAEALNRHFGPDGEEVVQSLLDDKGELVREWLEDAIQDLLRMEESERSKNMAQAGWDEDSLRRLMEVREDNHGFFK